VLVVPALMDRPLRFGELRRRLDGITQKSLTQTLRQLERDGFVSRTQYPTIPPRVEYDLTAKGRALEESIEAIGKWATRWISEADVDRKTANDAAAARPRAGRAATPNKRTTRSRVSKRR